MAAEQNSPGWLAGRMAEARAEVARLERIAATATCRELGCDWQHIGGRNCGCVEGCCSVPVLECSRCGDCDYGENAEAADRIARCEAAQDEEDAPLSPSSGPIPHGKRDGGGL